MNQTRRNLDCGLIVDGIALRLANMGLRVVEKGVFQRPQNRAIELGGAIEHLCFGAGQWEEFFPHGVPVLRELDVKQENGTWWNARLLCPTYWTAPILVVHEGTQPDLRSWRLLHFLEAASLLATAPGLGAIRYASPNGRSGVTELYILRKTGCAYVQCGCSPRGHHAAYTKMGRVSINERQL